MRKALAFILLISLCYYHIISLMIVEIGLSSRVNGIKAEQVGGDEITISLTKKEFQQYRHGNTELYIKGELFDIEKTCTSGNEVLVYCFNDKGETKMLTELESFFNRNVPQDKSSVPNVFFKFLSLVYVPSFYDSGFRVNESKVSPFCKSSLETLSAFFSVSTPPPRING